MTGAHLLYEGLLARRGLRVGTDRRGLAGGLPDDGVRPRAAADGQRLDRAAISGSGGAGQGGQGTVPEHPYAPPTSGTPYVPRQAPGPPTGRPTRPPGRSPRLRRRMSAPDVPPEPPSNPPSPLSPAANGCSPRYGASSPARTARRPCWWRREESRPECPAGCRQDGTGAPPHRREPDPSRRAPGPPPWRPPCCSPPYSPGTAPILGPGPTTPGCVPWSPASSPSADRGRSVLETPKGAHPVRTEWAPFVRRTPYWLYGP